MEKKIKKGLVSALIALSFLLFAAVSSFACTGVVKAVDGTSVTVTCGDGTAAVGSNVTVKDGKIVPVKKKREAIEGC